MRVAVVGGGIFGCTAAIHLARAGHDVHLLEAKNGLLRCASGINQFRLHAGYHYPRSQETVKECREALQSFHREYASAVHLTGKHLYAVSRYGSLLQADEYANAIMTLPSWSTDSASGLLNMDNVELVVSVKDEPWLDVSVLRGLVWGKMALSGVHVHLNAPADGTLRDEFDRIVVAGYASTNQIMQVLDLEPEQYQYEVCEKPVLKMPDEFRNVGIVVMDGAFCSLDPFLGTPYHVMGHVRHAIHHSNVGHAPEIPAELEDALNEGLTDIGPSHHRWMIDDAGQFIPALHVGRWMGSMYTVRAVLPNREEDDARPTLVQEMDAQVIRVFSGKIGTAVSAAEQVLSLVGTQSARVAAA